MTLQVTSRYVVAGLAVALFTFSASGVSAQTNLISQTQIDNQKTVVMTSLVETLRQDLKFLQMVYIQDLEMRVAYLKTLLAK